MLTVNWLLKRKSIKAILYILLGKRQFVKGSYTVSILTKTLGQSKYVNATPAPQ